MYLPEDVAEKLDHLNPLDKVSRERWAHVCAEVLLRSQPREVIRAIVAGGLLTFIGAAKPHYGVHAFKHEDYARIFGRLQAEVASWPAVPEAVPSIVFAARKPRTRSHIPVQPMSRLRRAIRWCRSWFSRHA